MTSRPLGLRSEARSAAAVELVPLGRVHADALAELAADPEVAGPANFRLPFTPADARDFIRARVGQRHARQSFTFALVADGSVVGSCGLHSLTPDDRAAEAAFWIGKPYWRQGYASAALREMLAFAFAGLGLVIVRARCLADNVGAMKVLRRARFRYVGWAEHADATTGAPTRVRTFALTCEDWLDA